MSINTIERVLWDIHHDPHLADLFRQTPDVLLERYGLEPAEKDLVKTLDVLAIANRGASQMLLFNAWLSIKGPGGIPEYLGQMAGA